jgi:hypothetical protein
MHAGNPLHGQADWKIMWVDEEYELPELKELVGKPVQIFMGNQHGSYHERWLDVFLIAPSLSSRKEQAYNIEQVDEFPFRSLRSSCQELIQRLGITEGPKPEDFPELDVSESPTDTTEKEVPRIEVETPYKPKPGESSQQYWDRLRHEETKPGEYYYKHPGG